MGVYKDEKTYSKHQLRLALALAENKEWMSARDLAKRANVSERMARSYCRQWTQEGYLKRVKLVDGYVYRSEEMPQELIELANQFVKKDEAQKQKGD